MLCASFFAAYANAESAYPLDSDDMAWFYNRPSATPEIVAADHARCISFGRRHWGREQEGTVQPGPYGLVGDVMGAIAAAGPIVATIDDCMISEGYRRFDVFGLPLRDFQERLLALPAQERAAYAGADSPPEGTLARQWANTYWLTTGDEAPQGPEPRRITPRVASVASANRWWGSAPLRLRTISGDALPVPMADGEAVAFLTLNSSTDTQVEVAFERVAPGTGDLASISYRGGNRWPAFQAQTTHDSGRNEFVFVIPAGTYALARIRRGRQGMGFCLGTIAFNVAPGDVVDLGHFTVEQGASVSAPAPPPVARMRVDQPELTPARRNFLGAGELANRMKQAAYSNGFPRICRPFSPIYGFDIPGAPLWNSEDQGQASQ